MTDIIRRLGYDLERLWAWLRRSPRYPSLLLLATVTLACQRVTPEPVPDPVPVPTPAPVPVPEPVPKPDDMTTRLLDAHNKFRAAKGLPALVLSPKLTAAAQAHSDYMAKVGRMAHSGIGDGSPWDRMAKAGYQMQSAAENVAWNQADVEAVMRAWMNSWGHRMNIMGGYSEFGGAVAYGKDGSPYWTSCFGTPGRAAVGAVPVESGPPAEVESEGGRLIPPARFGEGAR